MSTKKLSPQLSVRDGEKEAKGIRTALIFQVNLKSIRLKKPDSFSTSRDSEGNAPSTTVAKEHVQRPLFCEALGSPQVELRMPPNDPSHVPRTSLEPGLPELCQSEHSTWHVVGAP